MFREKETCDAIREVYSHLYPKKRERKKALDRVDLKTVVQSLRYRTEEVLAYQTFGTEELILKYQGPALFPQRGCEICSRIIQHHSTEVDVSYIRELWLLEDARFVELSAVRVEYRSANEGFYTRYRTFHHLMEARDWLDYSPEEVTGAFEDFYKYPFDAAPVNYYEV